MPLAIFRHRSLNVGTTITFVFMATFGATPYFLTLALQQGRGWNALQTGLAFILRCVCVLAGTVIGGRLATVRVLTGLDPARGDIRWRYRFASGDLNFDAPRIAAPFGFHPAPLA